MPESTRPAPTDKSGLYAPYFEGLTQGQIKVQQCANCSAVLWPPQDMCPECYATSLDWVEASNEGTIYTYSVYNRAFHPAFKELLPYGAVSVRVSPGATILGEYGGDPADIEVGQTVRAEFFQTAPGVALIRWMPSDLSTPAPNQPTTKE
ncbi:MAG: OB-fold domain-containing protein [Bifidobacteriaceae bacterium]|jgi:uncharacterized OB-fold protein|nr:OB-fold domain-containing protein [Bifidobacteriaceae bacterium]